MDKFIEEIINILKQEMKLYKDLVRLSDEKKNAIISGKVDEIDKIIKIEQNIVFDAGQLEKLRERSVDQYCVINGLKRENINLTELGKTLGDAAKNQLEKVQGELQSILGDLKNINDQNGALIKQSLEFIDFSINLITSTQIDSTSLYEEGKQSKRIFDAKA